MLALCSQDGIGFMESFFMNLLKVFRYVVIVMLDWNLPDEGLQSLKFVAHITMPRNSVLILFGSRVESLWVPSGTEQPHQYVAWERMFLMRSCLQFVNLVVLPFFVCAPFPFRGQRGKPGGEATPHDGDTTSLQWFPRSLRIWSCPRFPTASERYPRNSAPCRWIADTRGC